jgi:hypothetical protein
MYTALEVVVKLVVGSPHPSSEVLQLQTLYASAGVYRQWKIIKTAMNKKNDILPMIYLHNNLSYLQEYTFSVFYSIFGKIVSKANYPLEGLLSRNDQIPDRTYIKPVRSKVGII